MGLAEQDLAGLEACRVRSSQAPMGAARLQLGFVGTALAWDTLG